jgi:hypothetical protein
VPSLILLRRRPDDVNFRGITVRQTGKGLPCETPPFRSAYLRILLIMVFLLGMPCALLGVVGGGAGRYGLH